MSARLDNGGASSMWEGCGRKLSVTHWARIKRRSLGRFCVDRWPSLYIRGDQNATHSLSIPILPRFRNPDVPEWLLAPRQIWLILLSYSCIWFSRKLVSCKSGNKRRHLRRTRCSNLKEKEWIPEKNSIPFWRMTLHFITKEVGGSQSWRWRQTDWFWWITFKRSHRYEGLVHHLLLRGR